MEACIGCCVIKTITKIVHPSLPSTPSALLASESEISNSESITAKLSVQSKCSNSLKCSNSKPDSAADDIVHMPRVSAMKVTKINSLTPNRSYRMLDSNKVLNSKKAKNSPNRNYRKLPDKQCHGDGVEQCHDTGDEQCHVKDRLDSIEYANSLMFKHFEEDNLSSCASSVDEPIGQHEHATPVGSVQNAVESTINKSESHVHVGSGSFNSKINETVIPDIASTATPNGSYVDSTNNILSAEEVMCDMPARQGEADRHFVVRATVCGDSITA